MSEAKRAKTNSVKLNSGYEMPLLGLGTWKSKPGQVEKAVLAAIEDGYRHIDCAAVYGNEKEVGNALKQAFDNGLKREEIFVTSKVWNTNHAKEDVAPALEQTLSDLGLEYLDLYLIHWPYGFKKTGDDNFPKDAEGNIVYSDVSYLETWAAMEELVKAGKTKSIGLSNFNSEQIKDVLDHSNIKPAVLQIESHPYLIQEKLIPFAKELGITVTAYSPLASPDRPWAAEGEPLLLEDPKFKELAAKHNKTPAQIAIRYQIDRNVVVIPKSVTPSRIQENGDVFDFSLSEDDMKVVESFNKPWRACATQRDAKHPLHPFQIPF